MNAEVKQEELPVLKSDPLADVGDERKRSKTMSRKEIERTSLAQFSRHLLA